MATPWIRGKALQTLRALRPLQKGDEVLIVPTERGYKEEGRNLRNWKFPKISKVVAIGINSVPYFACRCRGDCDTPLSEGLVAVVGWRQKA